MNRITLCAASIACALASTAMAAPSAPSVDVYGSNNLQFSKIEARNGSHCGLQPNGQIP